MLKALLRGLAGAPLRAWRDRRRRRALCDVRHLIELETAGDFAAVIRAGAEMLARDPRHAQANRLCARALLRLQRPAEAVPLLRAALVQDPALDDVCADLSRALAATGDTAGALVAARRAVALNPGLVEHRLQLIDLLQSAGLTGEAVPEMLAALEYPPYRHELLLRAFEAVTALGWYSEALRLAEKARHELGDTPQSLALLASARYGLEDMAGAIEALDRAMQLGGERADSLVTLGSARFATGDVEAAIAAYRRALQLDPQSADARFHLGLIDLMRGEYDKGWQGFEQRYRRSRRRPVRPCVPAWDGGDLAGRSVLVMREQGLGDELMFASCYADLIDSAARCAIECDPRLQRLLARSFPAARFIALSDLNTLQQTDPGFAVDARIYAGSLPARWRRTAADFPRHDGYLRADSGRVAHWRRQLDALGPGLKAGLSWRGGSVFTHRARRNPPLRRLQPLLALPGLRWVNLQYGERAADLAQLGEWSGNGIADWPEAIDGDYDETAALVSALDLVVSVCTSIVHLAGALGQPAWVMTARVPEWRYGLDCAGMPWYPSVRLFRQNVQGVWDPVLQALEHELRQAAASGLNGGRC
jgi:tetratricopeptide (TPR) repeat protein